MISVLIAPDSFKGTLSAGEVCDIIGKAFSDTVKDIKTVKLPVADGGEGLCACFEKIAPGKRITAEVTGVFTEKMTAYYYMLDDMTAVIEMASCAGLPLAGDKKDPEKATAFGVGELIAHAVKNGAEHILLGLGGSATNDCGIGAASALGWKFLDESGRELDPVGGNLGKVTKIVPPEKKLAVPVTCACDVENPLFGEKGAAFVFAPQKGADEAAVKRLDNGLRNMAEVINRDLGIDISGIPGSGAAGGMGGGAVAFLGARLEKGIDIILDKSGFDEKAAQADLVITGEGRLDFQSADGKVISGVASRASALGKRVITVCGCRGTGAEKIMKLGVEKMYFSGDESTPFEKIIATCREDLYSAAVQAAKDCIY